MFPRTVVRETLSERFIPVELFVDYDENFELEKKLVKSTAQPVYVIVSPDEQVISVHQGWQQDEQAFVTFLNKGADRYVASR